MSSLPARSDGLHQFEEQLSEWKTVLSKTCNLLYALNMDDTDKLNEHLATAEEVSDHSLDVRKHHLAHFTAPKQKCVKLDVPIFEAIS